MREAVKRVKTQNTVAFYLIFASLI